MHVCLVAALDRRRLIGSDNRLPWRLPADLAHFRRLTLGRPILMGRRTYESLGRPLPGRHNIVLSRDPDFAVAGGTRVSSTEQGLAAAGEAEELMVIGGAAVYAQMLPRAERLYLTWVHAELSGDRYFPEIDPRDWVERERSEHAPDARNPYAYSFVTLERAGPPASPGSRPGS